MNRPRAAKGNALQLLARAYLKAGDVAEFERIMKEAENLASLLTGKEVTRGQYGLISVYEEYGKSYALIGVNFAITLVVSFSLCCG